MCIISLSCLGLLVELLVRHADFVCTSMLGEAVCARGAALQFALFEFRMDHDVVFEAVKQDLPLFHPLPSIWIHLVTALSPLSLLAALH